MPERKQIPKRLRFEVLKRDKFTCQYCGAQAPDVVLHIDHIIPVSEGGTNDITNLITSCADCNLGKSNVTLDDDSAVKKQKRQLDQLQERREQLEMMMDWQRELTSESMSGADIVLGIIEDMTGVQAKDPSLRSMANKWIAQFGLERVCDSTRKAMLQYRTDSIEGVDYAFSKIGGICYNSTHVTCWDCEHFKYGYGNRNRCMLDDTRLYSVKEAEKCEAFVVKGYRSKQ